MADRKDVSHVMPSGEELIPGLPARRPLQRRGSMTRSHSLAASETGMAAWEESSGSLKSRMILELLVWRELGRLSMFMWFHCMGTNWRLLCGVG